MSREEKIMERLAGFVIRFKRIIPIAAIILFALSIVATRNIRVTTQLKDMLPHDVPIVRSMEEINDRFDGGMSLLIVIEGEDKARMARCAQTFAEEVRADEKVMQYVKAINLKADPQFVAKWGFLMQEADDLERSRENLSRLNLLPFFTTLNDSLETVYTGEDAEEDLSTSRQETEAVGMMGQFDTFLTLLHDYLENPGAAPLDRQGRILAETFLHPNPYTYSWDNRMLLFSIAPNFSVDDIDKMMDMTAGIKSVLTRVNEQYPDISIGYTGEVAMGADEQDAMSFDMLVPALVALAAIGILFLISFRPTGSIALTVLVLITGIVFTFGFIGITIREITLVTSMMAVLLIGLGIDYGIQVVTNYVTFRKDGFDPEEAVRNTFRRAGMGTMLAAVTTALSFFVMAATGSKAFAQFGLVAGAGILLCFLAMFFILPSLLLLFSKKPPGRSKIPAVEYGFLSRLGSWAGKRRILVIIICLMITAGLFIAALSSSLEYDIMKLEPQNMTSFVYYEKVMESFGINPLSAMVIAEDEEEAWELTRAIEKEPLVANVSSIANYIPSDQEQEKRLLVIRSMRNDTDRYDPDYEYSQNDVEALMAQIQRLEYNIIELGDLSVAGLGEENRILKKRNLMIREIFGAEVGKPGEEVFQNLTGLLKSDPALFAERLTSLDRSFAREMDRVVAGMTAVDRPIEKEDLPDSIRRTLLEKEGEQNLVIIYPEKRATMSRASMERLNRRLGEISPEITGYTRILVSWMDDTIVKSRQAMIYIFAAVILFLLLSFRSVKRSLIAAVPLVVGMIWMFGLYRLIGLRLNAINIVVIPLVIGIGIDFGIHLVHRFTVEKEIGTVYRYTGKAVFLSALTTMIGFGSLALIGSFPSVASIGAILFFGIVTCLLTALFLLPSLLSFLNKKEHKEAENA